MRSAKWSGEAAVENQENGFLVPIIAQLDSLAIKILQGKIRSVGVYFYFCHLTSLDENLFARYSQQVGNLPAAIPIN